MAKYFDSINDLYLLESRCNDAIDELDMELVAFESCMYWDSEELYYEATSSIMAKLSNICSKAITFIDGIKNWFKTYCAPKINKGIAFCDKMVNKIPDIKIKSNYGIVRKTTFNIINAISRQLKVYINDLKQFEDIKSDLSKWDKTKYSALLVSLVIPNTTWEVMTIMILVDLLKSTVNNIIKSPIDNVVQLLRSTIEKLRHIHSEMADVGQKILDKLVKVLSLLKSQTEKALTELDNAINRN